MFLTKKVKCFATQKGVEPVTLKSSTLLKFAPFLISSAIMFTACNSSSSLRGKNKWRDILNEAISNRDGDQAHLNSIIDFYDAVNLTDSNFNHAPENNENFWEIVKNGLVIINNLQQNDNLTKDQKKDYKETAVKMMRQVVKIGDGDEVDLKNPANLRTFIFFEKVCHFKDQHHEIFVKSPKWIDEQNDFFGRDYLELEKFLDIAKETPGIAKFAKAFYNNEHRFIITEKDSAQANTISMHILADWLNKQDIHDKNLWYYGSVKDYDANSQNKQPLNTANYWYSRGKVVGASLGIDSSGYLGKGLMSPKGLIIIHELHHVLENPTKSGEEASDNHQDRVFDKGRPFDNAGELAELGPSLETLALTDKIYKKIHNIPPYHVVDYGVNIQIGTVHIPLGEIAQWYSQMMEKYPHKSISKLLQEKEVSSKLNDWGNGIYMSPILDNVSTRNL